MTTRSVWTALLAIGVAVVALQVGWRLSAQTPAPPFVCVLTPNPEAGYYRALDEPGERYELSGVSCPVIGDLMIYKNATDEARELALSSTPFLPRQRVGLLNVRGR